MGSSLGRRPVVDGGGDVEIDLEALNDDQHQEATETFLKGVHDCVWLADESEELLLPTEFSLLKSSVKHRNFNRLHTIQLGRELTVRIRNESRMLRTSWTKSWPHQTMTLAISI